MSGPNAGASFEFDATVPGSITGSPGVTAWADQSGNSRNLGPYNTAPTTGVGTINGNNAIRFNAAGSGLKSGAFVIAQPFTLYMVVQAQTLVTGTNQSHALSLANAALGMLGPAWMMNANGTAKTGGVTDLNPHVLSAVINGASSKLYVDGVLVASGDPGSGAIGYVLIGTGDPPDFQGLVGHLFGFPSAHSDANREAQQNFVMDKWGFYVPQTRIVVAPGMASRYAGQ